MCQINMVGIRSAIVLMSYKSPPLHYLFFEGMVYLQLSFNKTVVNNCFFFFFYGIALEVVK